MPKNGQCRCGGCKYEALSISHVDALFHIISRLITSYINTQELYISPEPDMEMHRLDTEELPPALEELDPSPIDETPSTFIPGSKDYFPPPQRSTTILGLSTQRIPYYRTFPSPPA